MRTCTSSRVLWITLIAYWTFLTALLLTPNPWQLLGSFPAPLKRSLETSLTDYVQHFLSFSLLGTLAWSARRAAAWATWVPFLCSLLTYAIAIELLQMAIPDRTFQWHDLFANTMGLLGGWAFPAVCLRQK